MISSLPRLRMTLVTQSILYATGLLLIGGWVTQWGDWYSASWPYRMQTDALMQGRLSLGNHPADLNFDCTWSQQGVHQVWGLGVPIWRLPWEAVAVFFGFAAFPDRIAFGLFSVIAALFFFSFLSSLVVNKTKLPLQKQSQWTDYSFIVTSFVLLFLFPPFITLMQTRGAVWEEAVCYEYLYAMLLLALLLIYFQKPSIRCFLTLCALAGLGGFIRPPLAFYGFGTFVIAVWILVVLQVSTQTKRADIPARKSLSPDTFSISRLLFSYGVKHKFSTFFPVFIGTGLFFSGIVLLCWTNFVRFGDSFEFGHQLNVQHFFGSMYATRFDAPFQSEPLPSAITELFGALFLVNDNLNGMNTYRQNFFPGQSPTVRWREFYFRTFDLSYVPLLLFTWGYSIRLAFKFKIWQTSIFNKLFNYHRCRYNLFVFIFGVWSLLASLPLTVFYLWTPVNSSRYMMDFAPAFAAATAMAWWSLMNSRRQKNIVRPLALFAFCFWIGFQFYFSTRLYVDPKNFDSVQLKNSYPEKEMREAPVLFEDPCKRLDSSHSISAPNFISYDRLGWVDHSGTQTGTLKPLIMILADNIDFVELDLEIQPHPRITPDPHAIRIKSGLEYLERDYIQKTDKGWRVRFQGPTQPRWKHGVQSVFIATVPNQHLTESFTPWILHSVCWRNGENVMEEDEMTASNR